ncbi:MaoC family dehydratase N-terminal domain-containing protein [Roseomonas sp. CECT 9278]|uniref:FAS1-like dehydratase domain-containing protein n=1 Tax=Roseomonas sp. CECT 9278 TaxID=2845823 RepID=UPI001E3AC186|nr:MaoC family dehydratase N-terminal domain-containing protein [Roseomonas sp. CECT 9278]CAH0157530.1 Mesaconyl-C(4)-CoA hydratase [Roseomonas sp. CECT 9278]
MSGNLQSWVGRTRRVADEMATPLVRRMAALTDRAGLDLARGAEVPNHWLCLLFDDAAPQAALGPDGHPTTGDFLPPVPLPRRMLGGRRLTYTTPPRIGDALDRETMIAAITPKVGRSGALIFVTLRHSITRGNEVIAVEEQDIAYLEAKRNAPEPKGEKPAPAPIAAWRDAFAPDPVMLFRYSALQFNGHRIHYDADYARDGEGYPALVVNGGVTTLFLLEAALRRQPGAQVLSTASRTMNPLFCGRSATLCGTAPDAQGRSILWAEDDTGAMALRIEARIG